MSLESCSRISHLLSTRVALVVAGGEGEKTKRVALEKILIFHFKNALMLKKREKENPLQDSV